MRTLLPVCFAAILVGCGGSTPSSPSPQPTPVPTPTPAPAPPPPFSLSGQWGGALAFSIDGTAASRGVTVNVEQTGLHVVGNYAASNDGQRGSFAFDLTAQRADAGIINGTIGVDAPSTDPAIRCRGTGVLTNSTASPFVLKALVVPLTNCDGALTAVSLTMTR